MRIKIFLIMIILLGLTSNIFPQSLNFRKAIFLHYSVGGNIYEDGVTTNVPNEVIQYNITNNLVGNESVEMDEMTYPPNYGGNPYWAWHELFDSASTTADDIYTFINDTTYDIFIIKSCYTNGVAVWSYTGGEDDTVQYRKDQSVSIYKWHFRRIVEKMALHPEKFFVIWTPALYTPANAPGGYALGDAFSSWMTDTLATGIDPVLGTFPDNVYIYDYFHDIDSLTYMPISLAVSPTDNHPNAAASELIAPLFVKNVFDAAIAYEGIVPVELTLFSGNYKDGVVNLKWVTATEVNNFGFEVERRNDNAGYKSIGFVNGCGTSTNKVTYNFVDKDLTSNRYYYRLKQIDFDGTIDYSDELNIEIDALSEFQLYQNYPNPFNPSTEIFYNLGKSGNITFKVYNNLGSEVATLFEGFMTAGKHSIKYYAKDTTSGIYFYQLKTDNFTSTRKMLLLK